MAASAGDDAGHDLHAGTHGDRQDGCVLTTGCQVLSAVEVDHRRLVFQGQHGGVGHHGRQPLGFQCAYIGIKTVAVFDRQLLRCARRQARAATEAAVLKPPVHAELTQLRALDIQNDRIDFHQFSRHIELRDQLAVHGLALW